MTKMLLSDLNSLYFSPCAFVGLLCSTVARPIGQTAGVNLRVALAGAVPRKPCISWNYFVEKMGVSMAFLC